MSLNLLRTQSKPVDFTSLYNTYFPQSAFSISFWINADFSQGDAGIFDNTISTLRHFFIRIRLNKLQIALENGDGGSYVNAYNAAMQNNMWQHVVLTISTGVGGQFKIYVDKILINSRSIGNTTWVPDQQMSYFGNLRGLLDDFRIYNRIITPEEVAALYNLGQTGNFFQFF
jgi:hypothetical protein